ncbi:hypothetical protein AJ85_18545 [Alkalihalobacillus alcalophilus ATCC 27647 = CGMCC 1.3604]|uniref:Uncharacterized protein n=1 Tax=Alkalihalobacillus alcalophilus ATCC 27647 = CGMCC 1.3604 TaxID=1218173 RepID=A0A4S4K050_ALKAL|nr:hypothetical protein [Alkalihalobacillus alcalophilus]MED1561455.1 hypothetical protein [Alkalihalobacillus alcalophilus]THG89299.1 hypothetical protein AJ85_18545 [Alkalihalobacillus alcalophilus ATCC 27647 = CGMCC 1.3604]
MTKRKGIFDVELNVNELLGSSHTIRNGTVFNRTIIFIIKRQLL